jgi:hypothetical protein
MISWVATRLGMVAMVASCSPEPSAQPVASPDAAFSASDPKCRLWMPRWEIAPAAIAAASTKAAEIKRVVNRIRLDAGNRLLWNKAPVDKLGLWQFLDKAKTVSPQPFVIVQADRHATCGALRVLIADTEKASNCSWTFCAFEWAEIPVDPKRGPDVHLPTYPL